jgi:diguanylate cyclase (GGDEF)-like protein/PAS domain S-box-containing protein
MPADIAPSRSTSRPPLTPWVVLSLALLALGSLIAYDLQREHAALDQQESRRLAHQAEIIEVNLARQLQLTVNALDGLRAQLNGRPLQNALQRQAELNRQLQATISGMTGVDSLNLIDRDGMILASSRAELLRSRLADPELLRTLNASQDPDLLHIGAPVGAEPQQYKIGLARLVLDARGRPVGALVARVEQEYFSILLRSALYAPDMRAGLVHGDGPLFLRIPDIEGVTGMNLVSRPSFTARHLASGRKASLDRGRMATTGEYRMLAVRTIVPESSRSDKPLAIWLSREFSAVYAVWDKDLVVRLTLFGAITLVSGLSLLLLQRRQLAHQRLLAEQQAAREQAEQRVLEQQAGLSQVEERLRDSQARFSRLLEDMRQAVMLFEDGHCIAANRAALAMLRLERVEQLLGRMSADFSPPRQPDGRDSTEKAAEMAWVAQELGSNVFEWELLRANGELFMVRVLLSSVEQGDKRLIHAVLHETSEQNMARQEVEFLAFHDGLTGLPNRVLGREQLQRAIESAGHSKSGLAVLQIGMHRLSAINEAYGQSVGDQLLLSMANRLGQVLRPQDLISRRAGDGFMAVLPDADSYGNVARLCDELLARCSRPFGIEGMQVACAVSLGAAFYPRDGEDADSLIQHADTALRQARKAGPESCYFFEPQMNAASARHAQLREQLRQALEDQAFELDYQPRVDLASGEPSGCEARVLWRHEGKAQALNEEELQAALDSGLILPLGRWTLQQACLQASRWQAEGIDPRYVSVSLSVLHCHGGQAERDVQTALRESGLAPDQLELLLPPVLLRRHDEACAAMLARLAGQGIRLCLDGYGDGYLNLAYLRQLKIGKLRLDMRCSQGAARLDPAQLRTLVRGAQELELETSASGVDRQETLELLRELGCDEAQGAVLTGKWCAEPDSNRHGVATVRT